MDGFWHTWTTALRCKTGYRFDIGGSEHGAGVQALWGILENKQKWTDLGAVEIFLIFATMAIYKPVGSSGLPLSLSCLSIFNFIY